MLPRVIAFALFTALAVGMIGLVLAGFRTGRIRHSDSSSTYSLRRESVRFGLVALVFSGLAAIFVYGAVQTAMAIWKSL
jgi:hypothetical protein